MTVRSGTAFALAIVLSCAAALAQIPQQASFDWFVGVWDIAYDDGRLGPVRGQARVTQSVDGRLNVLYRVVDPRDQTVHELSAFHVQQLGDVITMELPMGGPSAADTADGPAVTPPADVMTLDVPMGADLRATLQGNEEIARVGPSPAVANPQLRLIRKGERLEGEWIVHRDPDTGFKGARLGRPDTEIVPGPLQIRRDIMRGPEVWQTARMIVDDARRTAWKSAPATSTTTTGIARLTIIGRNLPGGPDRKADVRFTTPLLRPDNAQVVPALAGDTGISVPLDVDTRAIPGPKSFVVTDPGTSQQANSTWVFDWPSLSAKSISFVRKSLGDHYEPTTILYPGELFYVEVTAAPDEPGHARFYGIETTHPEPIQFHLVRDAADRTKYRSGPFLLLEYNEPIPPDSGAIEPQQIPLDTTALQTPEPTKPFVVRGEAGERLRTYHVAAQFGEQVHVAFAEVGEEIGDGRYQRALAKARASRQLYPGEDRYVISRFSLLTKGLARRTVVTDADHAALILLLEELQQKVSAMQRLHRRQFSRAELIRYGNALSESSGRKVPDPLLVYEVADYQSTGRTTLNAALYPFNLQREFGNDRQRRDDYVADAVAAALPQLVSHLGAAVARLDLVDISRPEELLSVVKPAYGGIAGPLVQELVRRARPDRGEPAHPRWVPDEPGRVAVRGISDLLGAIASDEQISAYELTWLSFPAMPLLTVGGVAGAVAGGLTGLAISTLGLSVAGADLYQNAAKLRTALDSRDTAYDLAPIAGYDAYHRARQQVRDQTIATVTSAAGALLEGLGTFAAVRDLQKAGLVRPPTVAAQQSAVTQAVEKGTEGLGPAAKANFNYVLGSAVETARTKGLSALSDVERRALRAAFPDGVPDDVAKTLKMDPGDPNFVIAPPDATTISVPLQSPPSPLASMASAPPVAARQSSSPLIRRLYGEAEGTARLGVQDAQARMARLERAAANWERLPSAAKGNVEEAMETFARLRRQNPAIAALD